MSDADTEPPSPRDGPVVVQHHVGEDVETLSIIEIDTAPVWKLPPWRVKRLKRDPTPPAHPPPGDRA